MVSPVQEILDELPLLALLPPETQELVRSAFTSVTVPFGTEIVREGEPGDAYFVIVHGRARVVKRGQDGKELSLNVLRRGDGFGEMGLLDAATRAVTVRASSEVELLRLDKVIFDAIVRVRPEVRQYLERQMQQRHRHAFLREFTAFAQLSGDALQAFMGVLEPRELSLGETVYREGDAPGAMYIVEDGRLRLFTSSGNRDRNVEYVRRGDFFGEVSVFGDVPRAESVEAMAPSRLLVLAAEHYQQLLDDQPEFRAQIEARVPVYANRHTALFPLDFARELLPAQASVPNAVSADQVQFTTEMSLADVEASLAAARTANSGPNAEVPHTSTPRVTAPFATPDGDFTKSSRRIRSLEHVRQVDEADCGAASLAMVCRHFGRAVSLSRIRQLAHTGLDGTSLRALCAAATELGLAARAVKTTDSHLEQMPLPAIAHWEGNHWVVVYDVSATHVRLADPATGRVKMSRADFSKAWTGYAALFDFTSAFDQAPEATSRMAWLTPMVAPWARTGMQVLGLALVLSLLQMVPPIFTQIIVDRVLVEADASLLRLLVFGMSAVTVFMVAGIVVQRYLLSFIAVRIDTAALDYLTRRLLALPMSYFGTRRTGDIQRRLDGMRHIREEVMQHGIAAATSAVLLTVTLGLMMAYSPTLTFVFLAVAPAYGLLLWYARRKLRPLYDQLEKAFGSYGSHQIDAIRGIETVKATSGESGFRDLMLAEFTALAGRRFRADFTALAFDGGIQVLTTVSVIAFLWAGAQQVMQGQLTVGAFVAFNALVALANPQLVRLLTTWDNLQLVSVLLDRLDDVLSQEPEQGADRTRLQPVASLEGRISCRDLTFRYGGPTSPPILDGISFDAMPNRTIAIVGRSGSGKTTLAKCLAGLLEPSAGTIHYDGVELRSLNYRDLRRHIGFVLQETHVFDDTIARNIAFGELDPDLDAVMWAARAASAHDFIERLPMGYDTRIGESGLAISGGQRQRVAIARALYRRPPVLIFDEATSALDAESERAVQENMRALLSGRTAFVIAHRLSTVRDADLILVLERGRIAEQGTHDELIAKQGFYYYLCSQQLGL